MNTPRAWRSGRLSAVADDRYVPLLNGWAWDDPNTNIERGRDPPRRAVHADTLDSVRPVSTGLARAHHDVCRIRRHRNDRTGREETS